MILFIAGCIGGCVGEVLFRWLRWRWSIQKVEQEKKLRKVSTIQPGEARVLRFFRDIDNQVKTLVDVVTNFSSSEVSVGLAGSLRASHYLSNWDIPEEYDQQNYDYIGRKGQYIAFTLRNTRFGSYKHLVVIMNKSDTPIVVNNCNVTIYWGDSRIEKYDISDFDSIFKSEDISDELKNFDSKHGRI